MHCAIDVREACAPSRTGKGQWTYGFVNELLSRDLALTLCTNRALPDEWGKMIALHPDRLHVRTDASKGLLWHWRMAQYFLRSSAIDTYISPVSYIVPFLVGKRKNVIPVVHDLIAFRHEPHDRKATFIERFTLMRAVFSACRIFTVSESTKKDLLQKFPTLSPENVSPVFAGPVFHDDQKNTSDGKTILCIATLCPRKNQLNLIKAFASLPSAVREQSRLVLVGKRGWQDDEIVRLASETSGVEWLSYLSDAECDALMRTAAVFAFPSLYEGFGMPLLDAFRIGLPVLASHRGSLSEVAGDAALLIDPENIESMCTGLVWLLTDQKLRTVLREKGYLRAKNFSWKRTVDLCVAALSR